MTTHKMITGLAETPGPPRSAMSISMRGMRRSTHAPWHMDMDLQYFFERSRMIERKDVEVERLARFEARTSGRQDAAITKLFQALPTAYSISAAWLTFKGRDGKISAQARAELKRLRSIAHRDFVPSLLSITLTGCRTTSWRAISPFPRTWCLRATARRPRQRRSISMACCNPLLSYMRI